MQIAAPSGWKRNGKHSRFTTPNLAVTQRNAVMVELAKRANVLELAKRYTELRRESAHEWSGPCPKCGGADRLHCTATWWFCSHCSDGSRAHRGDAIEFLQFVTGCGFTEAVATLTGDVSTNTPRPIVKSTPPPAPPSQTQEWRDAASREVDQAHEVLMTSQSTDAHAAYLLNRCIEPHTWQAYRLGAGRAVSRDDGQQHDCIVIPWYRAGQICAVRYRFIAPTGAQKTTSRPGSVFSERLWGGQALSGGVTALSTLVLCEGELNAASIWQVGHDLGFDVLSLGSESQRITEAMLTYARRFAHIIVWMDKDERVKGLLEKLPHAIGIASPDGKDANDMLRSGLLQAMLCELRLRACADDNAREGLLWDIWDSAHRFMPLGDGVWQFAVALAAKLGRDIEQGRP